MPDWLNFPDGATRRENYLDIFLRPIGPSLVSIGESEFELERFGAGKFARGFDSGHQVHLLGFRLRI